MHFPVNLSQYLANFEHEQLSVQFTPHVFQEQGLLHIAPVQPKVQLHDPVPRSQDAPFLHWHF